MKTGIMKSQFMKKIDEINDLFAVEGNTPYEGGPQLFPADLRIAVHGYIHRDEVIDTVNTGFNHDDGIDYFPVYHHDMPVMLIRAKKTSMPPSLIIHCAEIISIDIIYYENDIDATYWDNGMLFLTDFEKRIRTIVNKKRNAMLIVNNTYRYIEFLVYGSYHYSECPVFAINGDLVAGAVIDPDNWYNYQLFNPAYKMSTEIGRHDRIKLQKTRGGFIAYAAIRHQVIPYYNKIHISDADIDKRVWYPDNSHDTNRNVSYHYGELITCLMDADPDQFSRKERLNCIFRNSTHPVYDNDAYWDVNMYWRGVYV